VPETESHSSEQGPLAEQDTLLFAAQALSEGRAHEEHITAHTALEKQTDELAAENANRLIDDLSESAARITVSKERQLAEAKIAADEQLDQLKAYLATGDYDDEMLQKSLRAIGDVGDANQSLNAFRVVDAVPADRLKPYFVDETSDLHRILQRAAATAQTSAQFRRGMLTVEHAVSSVLTDSRPTNWKREGKIRAELPEYLERPLSSVEFHEFCADRALVEVKTSGAQGQELQAQLSKAEYIYLRHTIGLSEEAAEDLQMATTNKRVLSQQRKGEALSDDSRRDLFEATLHRVARNTAELSPDDLWRLGQSPAGIVNFDQYGNDVLKTRLKLLNGDPELRARAQAGDLTVLTQNAFEAFSGEATRINEAIGRSDLTIVGDVKATDGGAAIGEITDLLKLVNTQLNTGPANLVMSTHGSPDGLVYTRPADTIGVENYHVTREDLARLGRQLGTLMQPGKETGERVVALLACLQNRPVEVPEPPKTRLGRALRSVARNLSFKAPEPYSVLSPGNTIVAATKKKDNVTVLASDQTVIVEGSNTGDIRLSNSAGDTLPVHEIRKGGQTETDRVRLNRKGAA
jgi:hypothetical protein